MVKTVETGQNSYRVELKWISIKNEKILILWSEIQKENEMKIENNGIENGNQTLQKADKESMMTKTNQSETCEDLYHFNSNN